MQTMMLWTYLSIVIALLVYLGTCIYCGQQRGKHKILAPAMTGHPDFERAVRIQQNTIEQLVMFVPAVWIFGLVINPLWAAGLGLVWSVGRVLYALAYAKDPAKRGAGFLIAFAALGILLLGDVVKILIGLASGGA